MRAFLLTLSAAAAALLPGGLPLAAPEVRASPADPGATPADPTGVSAQVQAARHARALAQRRAGVLPTGSAAGFAAMRGEPSEMPPAAARRGLPGMLRVQAPATGDAGAATPARPRAGTARRAATAGAAGAGAAGAAGASTGAAGRVDDPITLNFRDADIDSVVAAFGQLLGRTFVIDPRVRGKVTLETPRPVTRVQAYELLQSALRLQGFAIVETATGLARVVPEADAKLQPGPVNAAPAARPPVQGGEQVVTQIFRLNYESASNMVNVLRPLISPNNTITAYPNNNSLVVTDYASNVARIGRIVASLDAPSTSEVEVVQIRNGLASDAAVLLTRLLDGTGGTPGAPGAPAAAPGAPVDAGQRVSVLADTRTNSVLIRSGSPARMNLAKSLLVRLDQPTSQPGNINVVYLRNAEAARLAQVLRGVLAGEGGAGAGTAGAAGTASGFGGTGAFGGTGTTGAFGTTGTTGGAFGAAGSTPATTPLQSGVSGAGPTSFAAGGAVIAADPATNSLIITAPESIYRNLRAVIDKLDARRAQVYIESLIVEVSAERAAEFGVQFQFLDGLTGDSSRAFGGTNLPQRNSGGNILDLATNPLTAGQGLNLGVSRGTIQFAGTTIANLGLLARALETDARANILATPNLLTLDNEEARIIIGQNVPFITGSFTSAATGGTNPFQTIERRDVGTTLRVRPQVSEAGTVTLRIFQEVSSVSDRTLQQGLITNRRAIESNVLVDDGQIIVLGGLIEERVEGGVNQVPGLGSLPFVGQLFRYDTRRRVKTNLLVFLRPIVLRTADSTYGVTADRYDYVRQLQSDSRLPPHWLLPEFPPSPVPALPPRPLDPAARPPGAPDAPRPGPSSLSPDIDAARRTTAPVRESQPLLPDPATAPGALPPGALPPGALPPGAGLPGAAAPGSTLPGPVGPGLTPPAPVPGAPIPPGTLQIEPLTPRALPGGATMRAPNEVFVPMPVRGLPEPATAAASGEVSTQTTPTDPAPASGQPTGAAGGSGWGAAGASGAISPN